MYLTKSLVGTSQYSHFPNCSDIPDLCCTIANRFCALLIPSQKFLINMNFVLIIYCENIPLEKILTRIRTYLDLLLKFGPMWRTKYALAVSINLGLGFDFRPCSECDFLPGRPQSVYMGDLIFIFQYMYVVEYIIQSCAYQFG